MCDHELFQCFVCYHLTCLTSNFPNLSLAMLLLWSVSVASWSYPFHMCGMTTSFLQSNPIGHTSFYFVTIKHYYLGQISVCSSCLTPALTERLLTIQPPPEPTSNQTHTAANVSGSNDQPVFCLSWISLVFVVSFNCTFFKTCFFHAFFFYIPNGFSNCQT